MRHNARSIPILTYHSISSREGPTNIPADVFRAQMDVLAKTGTNVLSLDEFHDWHRGKTEVSDRSIVITFDDAFADFSDVAFPILDAHGFPACVFAPVACLGAAEDWHGAEEPPRLLMSLKQIKTLAAKGITFGAHSLTHPDLRTLDDKEMKSEIDESGRELSESIGAPVRFFAPPYGTSNAAVRRKIAENYALSVGVRLGIATRSSPLFDLPRIEMHYFRDPKRWETFVRKGGSAYYQMRRAARSVRETGSYIRHKVRYRPSH